MPDSTVSALREEYDGLGIKASRVHRFTGEALDWRGTFVSAICGANIERPIMRVPTDTTKLYCKKCERKIANAK